MALESGQKMEKMQLDSDPVAQVSNLTATVNDLIDLVSDLQDRIKAQEEKPAPEAQESKTVIEIQQPAKGVRSRRTSMA